MDEALAAIYDETSGEGGDERGRGQRSRRPWPVRPQPRQVARRHPHLLQGGRRHRHPERRHREKGPDPASVRAGDAQERRAEPATRRHADVAERPHPRAHQGNGAHGRPRRRREDQAPARTENPPGRPGRAQSQGTFAAATRALHRLEMDHRPQPEELPAVPRHDCPGKSLFLFARATFEQLDRDRVHGPERLDGRFGRLRLGHRLDLRLAARAEHARRRLRHRGRRSHRAMRQRSRWT